MRHGLCIPHAVSALQYAIVVSPTDEVVLSRHTDAYVESSSGVER